MPVLAAGGGRGVGSRGGGVLAAGGGGVSGFPSLAKRIRGNDIHTHTHIHTHFANKFAQQ